MRYKIADEARALLKPTAVVAHRHRKTRLDLLADIERDPLFFDAQQIRDTFENLQFDGENHRRLTPHLMEMFAKYRPETIAALRNECQRMTAEHDWQRYYDVAILGSGPHGVCVASYLREQFPKVTTVIVEKNAVPGGQWSSYGDKPAFVMNSRVRPANRTLPARPCTPGNINYLGPNVPLEISDVVNTQYPTNVDMGDVCALNGYLSADTVLVGCEYSRGTSLVKTPDGERNLAFRQIVDATGFQTNSAIGDYSRYPNYYRTADLYRHFGTHPMPLQQFDGKNVAVIGAGDSALTVLEALLSVLPRDTYGPIGRYQPKMIFWYGTSTRDKTLLDSTLRPRYKNGIVQAIGRTVTLVAGQVDRLTCTYDATWLVAGPGGEFVADYVIDCTTENIPRTGGVVTKVGPGARSLPTDILTLVNRLKLPANTISLWATMDQTASAASDVGRRAMAGKRRR